MILIISSTPAELVFCAAIASLSAFAIIARGIMTLVSKKNPYTLDDYDKGAVIRKKDASGITGALLALLGGLTNAVFGIITLIQMFDWGLFNSCNATRNSSYATSGIPALFNIFILALSLVGAIVMLFNRFQGSIYILICAFFGLLLGSVFLSSQDQNAMLLILPQLALLVSAVIGLVGYNKTKKRLNEPDAIKDVENDTSDQNIIKQSEHGA